MTEEYHDWEAQQDSLAAKDRESLVSTAWKYFTSHMGESTGFVSSTNSFPFATLWDISSELLAMHSARELEIISQSWFDCHVQKILQSMVKMPLLVNDGALLPNRLYSVDSLEPADDTGAIGRYCGWSSTDIGVFLETKKVLSEACPNLRSPLEDVTSRWDLEQAVVEGVIQGFRKTTTTTGVVGGGGGGERFDEDKYPYGTLSTKGFELEGLSVRVPRQPSHSTVVHGGTVPWDDYGMTTLEPFVYEEIFAGRGLGRWLNAGSLRSMLNVQLKHFLASGAFTCASEVPIDVQPYYVYYCTLCGYPGVEGVPFTMVSGSTALKGVPHLSAVSARCVVIADLLYPNAYWNHLAREAISRLATNEGFLSGFYAFGLQPIFVCDVNTNAVILESVAAAKLSE